MFILIKYFDEKIYMIKIEQYSTDIEYLSVFSCHGHNIQNDSLSILTPIFHLIMNSSKFRFVKFLNTHKDFVSKFLRRFVL